MEINPLIFGLISLVLSIGGSIFAAGRMVGRVTVRVDQNERDITKMSVKLGNCMPKPECAIRHENFCSKIEELKRLIEKMESKNDARSRRSEEQFLEFTKLIGSFQQYIETHR